MGQITEKVLLKNYVDIVKSNEGLIHTGKWGQSKINNS